MARGKGKPVDQRQLDFFSAPAPERAPEPKLSPPPSEHHPIHPKPAPPMPVVARVENTPLSELLALDRNLALMAGAGAGKTHNLVSICLHLLGGARQGLRIAPAQLCLLTFTDKAAAELRERLRQRLDRLALDEVKPHEEPELRAAFERVERPFPSPEEWRVIRDELGAAMVGTFHSLCVQLLRRAPGGLGVDPAFRLLEEREAGELIRNAAERLVLKELEAENQAVVELCRELNFAGAGGFSNGVVDYLCQVFGRVREEGISPLDIAISGEDKTRAQFETEVRDLAQLVASARSSLSPALLARFGTTLGCCATALEGMSLGNFTSPERFPAMRRAVAGERGLWQQRGEDGALLKEIRWRVLGNEERGYRGLAAFFGAWVVVPHERAFVDLLGQLQQAHRYELSRRGALDFSELLILARNLLRDHPSVRADVQQRVGALLVDEFQDTNRLQLELVTLMAEKRDGAPRPLSMPLGRGPGGPRNTEALQLPLEPGFLCAVGDRKQSIYEFRGADVSVFEVLAKKIEREGGARAYLQDNWRSSPELLGFFNQLFSRLMAPRSEPRDYEVAYLAAGDDLRPVRPKRAPTAPVLRLVYSAEKDTPAEQCRQADAESVGRYLRQLLSRGFEVEQKDGLHRPGRGGDVAVLFRRFTHLETYRQALIRHRVPHRVIRGRGFYGAQEVLDMASLLSLIADPSDGLSFAAVLRSPLVGLSDSSLFRLAQEGEGRLWLPLLLKPGQPVRFPLPEQEQFLLQRFTSLYRALRGEKDRLGIRALLRVALQETGYRVAMAGTAFAEQALANLDKLLELARRWDAQGIGDCSVFAQELLDLASRDPTEAQADVLDVGDPRAVQLLTIHQSKGLEWPVVVAPDLAARPNSDGARVRFDRQLGLSIKPWVGDESAVPSPRFKELMDEQSRRANAESLRLLYVALTRARDLLVLSGHTRAPTGTWWWAMDQAIGQELGLRTLVADCGAEELAALLPPPAGPTQVTAEQVARVEAMRARVRDTNVARAHQAVFPVTHLQDYFRCPRRYLYAHRVGLSEFPVEVDLDEGAGEGRSGGDWRIRGTLAHHLLERTRLDWVGTGQLLPELRRVLWEEGMDPESEEGREILEWVSGFWKSDFARQLKEGGESRLRRELPFLLRLGGTDGKLALYLKGQIDLLWQGENGECVVVDYKASVRPPSGLEGYQFQLACYALAARQLVGPQPTLRAGIAFLRQPRVDPEFLSPAQLGTQGLTEQLVAGAEELLGRAPGQEWPGREVEHCQKIGCGYRYRCHPSSQR